jgi:hypothetical protein
MTHETACHGKDCRALLTTATCRTDHSVGGTTCRPTSRRRVIPSRYTDQAHTAPSDRCITRTEQTAADRELPHRWPRCRS